MIAKDVKWGKVESDAFSKAQRVSVRMRLTIV
jgi:hypothetical protein